MLTGPAIFIPREIHIDFLCKTVLQALSMGIINMEKALKEGYFLDSERAKQIISSDDRIDVLYQGIPVWLEKVKDNNMVEVSYLESHTKEEMPAYKLVEIK